MDTVNAFSVFAVSAPPSAGRFGKFLFRAVTVPSSLQITAVMLRLPRPHFGRFAHCSHWELLPIDKLLQRFLRRPKLESDISR